MVSSRPSRSTVYSSRGMVSSASPLAASAGTQVLNSGGNAFDAAVAMAAVEGVTLPSKCGLGGDLFAILYQASTGRLQSISSVGPAPSGATLEMYKSQGHDIVPPVGPLTITVPGEVAGWEHIHRNFGTKPFDQLLEPAIGYAEEGFPITPWIGEEFVEYVEQLAKIPATARILVNGHCPYKEGDVLVQKDLARSLRRVASGGADEFYRGELSRELVKDLQDCGAPFAEDDLAKHSIEIQEPPLAGTYRGHTIYQTSPPSQGFLLLEILNILEGWDLASLGHNTAETIHLMVETKKLAYADRNKYAGDPRIVAWPLDEILSKDYAAQQLERIDLGRAAETVAPSIPVHADGDTSYFCVVDGEGNCVSLIHSISGPFGSRIVGESTGIMLNNRAGSFNLLEGHPNCIEPGKRPMHTLNCYIVFKDELPFIVGGTPGFDFQPQGNTQMITGLIDFGLGVQEVVDVARWFSLPGTNPRTYANPYRVFLEEDMPEETVKGLEARGHTVSFPNENVFGRVQLIVFDRERGILAGGSDQRSDGHSRAI